jgi:hypothetical protein
MSWYTVTGQTALPRSRWREQPYAITRSAPPPNVRTRCETIAPPHTPQ